MAFAAGKRAAAPFNSLTTSVVLVEGPAMTNVLKSNLTWQMLLLQGQTSKAH